MEGQFRNNVKGIRLQGIKLRDRSSTIELTIKLEEMEG